ncbi:MULTISPECIES: hypothetical protein [unclassified Streptomyces]|uniref:hypothetical protein n=1 Tax=unclassified Streptomyces TaxID=2593676 RepID=UPI001BE51A73|nr:MULTISPECIES: hypothetical protein [unclassified Streptomyces]MBT2406612.1 hypothetical protein [Streptomyces sp. ISL-21]MBT2458080.1 hypothetical protein [Streptomyces sp. ISL-86]MBT2608950.1 hypothetical protein [Streptomyces sp. ISL-87]
MHRQTRRAVVTSLLASSLALSGVVALAPAAGAAVPVASCTVTPSPDGTSVTIAGQGFTPPRDLSDGESRERLNIDANGNFLVKRFQKNVHYTVLAVNENQNFIFVNCKVVQSGKNTERERAQGRRDGREAGRDAARESCQVRPRPDRRISHTDAYWEGWTEGANRAFDRACHIR